MYRSLIGEESEKNSGTKAEQQMQQQQVVAPAGCRGAPDERHEVRSESLHREVRASGDRDEAGTQRNSAKCGRYTCCRPHRPCVMERSFRGADHWKFICQSHSVCVEVRDTYPLLLRGYKGLETRGHAETQLVNEWGLRLAVDLHPHACLEGCILWKGRQMGRSS